MEQDSLDTLKVQMSPKRTSPTKTPSKGDKTRNKEQKDFALNLSGSRRESKGPSETAANTTTSTAGSIPKLLPGAGAELNPILDAMTPTL
jgi:hypothetical protein